jgi:hypothetical protein
VTDLVYGTDNNAAVATLQEAALRELVNAHVITGFTARGQGRGFVIEAAIGTDGDRTAVLGNTRSGPRVFASLTTIALLLKRLGFDRFTVDTAQYVPGRVRAARPDRAAAMTKVKLPTPTAKTKARVPR